MRTAAALALLIAAGTATAGEPVDFRKHVYPLLHDRCFKCHQGEDAKSGVRLDLRAEVLARAKPGKSRESLLIRLVSGGDPDRVMPPKGERLTVEQIEILRGWIDEGVQWDDKLLPPLDATAKHWAFQPVRRPAIPQISNLKFQISNPIDAFIHAKWDEKDLKPAPPADRRTLLRRLALDLTGLPPRPEEIEAFLEDRRPDAYERQVERLLASPAYGERWGRHWLDVARNADSEGYESDHVRPYAWRYRDYVIKAFNDDKPFDRFVLEQLAGDELVPYRDEHLIATGFLAAARLSSNEEDKARQLNDMYVDIVNATGAAFLGLTFNCAQCHAHKFDPITHRDYYRFQGFFLKGIPYNLRLRDPAANRAYAAAKPPEYDESKQKLQTYLDAARAKLGAKARESLKPEELAAYDTPADQRTPEQHALAVAAELKFQFTQAQIENAIPADEKKSYSELMKTIAEIEAKLPDPPQTWGFYSPATSPHEVEVLPMKGFYPPPFDRLSLGRARPFLLHAGDSSRRGPALNAGWPAVFGPTPRDAVARRPRTALAKWLTDRDNPLTARVWVNRVWHYHFGRGLVETGGDFGVRGSPPSHPELLDWLAAELMEPAEGRQWSTKHIHRLIVTSSTYRQSSKVDSAVAARDPDGRYLTRWKPRRLEAEVVRDAALLVSGDLDAAIGGKPDENEETSIRRAVYQLHRRQKPTELASIFDGPTGATESCPKRITTSTPLGALFLMNNRFMFARATSFAGRVESIAGADTGRQIDTTFRLALGRLPTEKEREAIENFFANTEDDRDRLIHLCHAILCTTEFLTLE